MLNQNFGSNWSAHRKSPPRQWFLHHRILRQSIRHWILRTCWIGGLTMLGWCGAVESAEAAEATLTLPGTTRSWSTRLSAEAGPGQDQVDDRRREEVLDLLEAVHLRAEQVADPLHRVALRAKAAGLLWEFDPALALTRFELIRAWIEQQPAETFPTDRARAELLRFLFPRNAQLARSWLNQMLDAYDRLDSSGRGRVRDTERSDRGKGEGNQNRTEHRNEEKKDIGSGSITGEPARAVTLEARLEGKASDLRLLNQLADQLVEVNPPLAGEVLGTSFERGYSYPAHAALRRLFQQDPLLGGRLARQLLARLPTYPLSEALTAAQFLFEVAFPAPLSGGPSVASQSEIQTLYLATARQILYRSLHQSPRPFPTPRDQQVWEGNQALLGIILDVFEEGMISPQNQAALARLEAALPPQLQGFREVVRSRRQAYLSTRSPAEKATVVGLEAGKGRLLDRVGHALNRGDLAGAKELLRQMENIPQDKEARPLVEQLVLHTTVRDRLARGQLAAAIPLIQSIRDPFQRAAFFGNLIRAARLAPEPQFAQHLAEVLRTETGGFPCSPQKILLILPLVSLGNPWDLLEQSISCMNSLPTVEGQLFSLDTFQSPFRSLAKDAWPQTLEAISTIRSPALELLARLAASEGALLPSRVELPTNQKEASDGNHDR